LKFMKDMNCEDVLIQKLALIDGEKSELSEAEIGAHLANCENCRREIADLQNTIGVFSRQTRQASDADLWTAIEKRIGAENESLLPAKWQPFVVLGVFLVLYKLLEMVPERDFGWALKIVPFILAAAIFGFLRENPFKINTELRLEK
jgi:predicted anti-sigma-YlaC factor YlaD